VALEYHLKVTRNQAGVAMTSPLDNQLLAMLPAQDFSALNRYFTTVELRQGESLAQPGDEIRKVYFPHYGIISFVVELADGDIVQTGMVGRDGVVGAPQALDDKVSLNKIIVQLPGIASVIDRAPLREAVLSRNLIRKLFAAHEQFFIADIQQTAACNALHAVPARMCRWMLRMRDLAGTEMPLTQEYLAAMIGVTRPSVTSVASRLQTEGLISYKRGQIRIENVDRLKESSCECHEAVQLNYERLFGSFIAPIESSSELGQLISN
jgi:CRP-like cAMP-binding protein